MLQIAPGSPARLARRYNSWEQKKVPSRTICDTARQPLATEVLGGDGKVGRGVVDEDASRSEGVFERVEGGHDVVGPSDVGAGVGGPASHRLYRRHAGQPVVFAARQDPDRGAQTGELDGDGLAETGPPAGHHHRAPVEGARREHHLPGGRWLREGHGDYLPSKTMGCFLALAAYPAGMSSETNSIDELMAPKRMASVKPR